MWAACTIQAHVRLRQARQRRGAHTTAPLDVLTTAPLEEEAAANASAAEATPSEPRAVGARAMASLAVARPIAPLLRSGWLWKQSLRYKSRRRPRWAELARDGVLSYMLSSRAARADRREVDIRGSTITICPPATLEIKVKDQARHGNVFVPRAVWTFEADPKELQLWHAALVAASMARGSP